MPPAADVGTPASQPSGCQSPGPAPNQDGQVGDPSRATRAFLSIRNLQLGPLHPRPGTGPDRQDTPAPVTPDPSSWTGTPGE